MPSSFSSQLRLTLQADGENTSTWGDIVNAVFNLLESAIAGVTTIAVSTGTTTLTTNNGASDQARNAVIILTGALSGNVTVVIPNVGKQYIIFNNTSGAFSVTIATAAPVTSAVITQGTSQLVFCDGANNVFVPVANATSLGGVAAANYARKDAGQSNLFSARNAETFQNVAYAATITLDASTGNSFGTTITGATTLASPINPADGQQICWFLTQDATGGRTVGFGAAWLFPNGIPGTVDLTPSATTVLLAKYNGALAKWVVYAVNTGFNGTAVTGNITISQNTQNVSVFRLAGSPGVAVNVTVTVAPGVLVTATDPQAYAMDFSGFVAGSVITLTNNGYIVGRGGNGGEGGAQGKGGSTSTSVTQGARGRTGGTAINGPGAGSTLNITNSNGFIWGGGGGGGGGGTSAPGSGGDSNGGGGGGGAGGSLGGDGGNSGVANGNNQGTNGGDGTWLTSGANGAGGVGAGSTVGQTGGNGGDWGAAGTAGTNGGNTVGGGAGAAGKAVNKNGATVNFTSGGTAPNVKGAVS